MPAIQTSLLVYGAGWTGRQIAAQAAGHGVLTTLVDLNPSQCESAIAWGVMHAKQMVEQKLWGAFEGKLPLKTLPIEDWHLERFDVILECLPEQISLKRRVLKEISMKCDGTTIIASNSSYFVPSWLESKVHLPQRFAHWHFHVPVWIANLVDIVPCSKTDALVLGRLEALSKTIGQLPIVQTKENSGYLFNAMLQSVLTSALQLAQREIGSWREIDLAWQKVTQMPLGPFGIMDQIGLDLVLESFCNARWLPNASEIEGLTAILRPHVEAGNLGVKTGRGFYEYPDPIERLASNDPNQEAEPHHQSQNGQG